MKLGRMSSPEQEAIGSAFGRVVTAPPRQLGGDQAADACYRNTSASAG